MSCRVPWIRHCDRRFRLWLSRVNMRDRNLCACWIAMTRNGTEQDCVCWKVKLTLCNASERSSISSRSTAATLLWATERVIYVSRNRSRRAVCYCVEIAHYTRKLLSKLSIPRSRSAEFRWGYRVTALTWKHRRRGLNLNEALLYPARPHCKRADSCAVSIQSIAVSVHAEKSRSWNLTKGNTTCASEWPDAYQHLPKDKWEMKQVLPYDPDNGWCHGGQDVCVWWRVAAANSA